MAKKKKPAGKLDSEKGVVSKGKYFCGGAKRNTEKHMSLSSRTKRRHHILICVNKQSLHCETNALFSSQLQRGDGSTKGPR